MRVDDSTVQARTGAGKDSFRSGTASRSVSSAIIFGAAASFTHSRLNDGEKPP